jgi:hypothetical protein
MGKKKGESRLNQVKQYLLSIGVNFEEVDYGNGLGRTLCLDGTYSGALVNCFNTGNVNVQGGCARIDEIRALITENFPNR